MAINFAECNMEFKNGTLQITCPFEEKERLLETQFFTQHPSKKQTVYCLPNDTAHRYFTKYRSTLESIKGFCDVYKALEINTTRHISPVKLPKDPLPGVELMEHQLLGLKHMLMYPRTLLSMGPGTGKTYIMAAYTLHAGLERYVIVTPKNVKGQVAQSIAEKTGKVIGYKKDIDAVIKDMKDGDTIVIHYEQLSKISTLRDKSTALIFDESQNLKRFGGDANNEAYRLQKSCEAVQMLSGSTLDKNRFEVLGQLRILDDIALPTKTSVMNRYFEVDERYKPTDEKPLMTYELNQLIDKYSISIDTEKVLDLPPMVNTVWKTSFKDKKVYNAFRDHGIYRFPDKDVALAKNAGAKRMKLRQLCSGFIITEAGKAVRFENPKEGLLREYLMTTPHAIIFVEFMEEIEMVSEQLDLLDMSYGVLSGKHKKIDAVAQFKKKEIDYLVMQLKSGNAGLDLSVTNHVLFYALPESAIVLKQARYRIRRIGQTQPCYYTYFAVRGTVETSKLLPNLRLKKSVQDKEMERTEYERDEIESID